MPPFSASNAPWTENGLIVGEAFREGNAVPAAGNLEFIRYCEQRMPAGKRIVAVRADSTADQVAIFNACEDKKQRFAIGADLDAAVIAEIPETAWVKWRDARDRRDRAQLGDLSAFTINLSTNPGAF